MIEEVTVRTYDLAAGLLNRYPHNSENQVAYQFSLPYVVAFALLRKNLSYLNYVVKNLHDSDIAALAAKVKVVGDVELTGRYPDVTSSIVEVCGSGFKDRELCEMPKGDPRVPVTEAEVAEKFMQLTIPALGEEGAGELKDMVDNFDALKDARVIGEVTRKWISGKTRGGAA